MIVDYSRQLIGPRELEQDWSSLVAHLKQHLNPPIDGQHATSVANSMSLFNRFGVLAL